MISVRLPLLLSILLLSLPVFPIFSFRFSFLLSICLFLFVPVLALILFPSLSFLNICPPFASSIYFYFSLFCLFSLFLFNSSLLLALFPSLFFFVSVFLVFLLVFFPFLFLNCLLCSFLSLRTLYFSNFFLVLKTEMNENILLD